MQIFQYEDRIISEAEYILRNKSTIRKAAKAFNISKSSLHIDVSKRLMKLDYELYLKVKEVLDYNYSIKHIRGGVSTKNKYQSKS